MLSGHGGIGRRVRLRGVWLHRPSSSLGDRTTKKTRVKRLVFFFCAVHRDLRATAVARRIYAQLGLRPTDASLWRVNSPRFAITLASLATSLESDIKKKHGQSIRVFLLGGRRDLNLCAKNLHTTMLCIVRTAPPVARD